MPILVQPSKNTSHIKKAFCFPLEHFLCDEFFLKVNLNDLAPIFPGNVKNMLPNFKYMKALFLIIETYHELVII